MNTATCLTTSGQRLTRTIRTPGPAVILAEWARDDTQPHPTTPQTAWHTPGAPAATWALRSPASPRYACPCSWAAGASAPRPAPSAFSPW